MNSTNDQIKHSAATDGKPPVLRSASEDEQCPTNDYTVGEPQGTCWGDGHYECKNCKHYREDFKRLGQDFIDFTHQQQGAIRFISMAYNVFGLGEGGD